MICARVLLLFQAASGGGGGATNNADGFAELVSATEWVVAQPARECRGNFFTASDVVEANGLIPLSSSSSSSSSPSVDGTTSSQRSVFLPSTHASTPRGTALPGGVGDRFPGRMPPEVSDFVSLPTHNDGSSVSSGSSGSLKGKTVFVTGGSRGIGLSIAKRASADGANVVLAAKTDQPHPKLPGTIHTAAAECMAGGAAGALALKLDIQDDDGIQVGWLVGWLVGRFVR